MMKLQLALDDLTPEEALKLTEQVRESVDIIEIGTPMVIREGMRAVEAMKQRFPDKEILADLKIMDAGYYEAELAFKAGADYITVLGVTDIFTVRSCMEAAADYGGKVVVDMICVPDLPKRIEELKKLHVHCLAVHTGTDQQAYGRTPMDDLKVMKRFAENTAVSVAGGINSTTAGAYAKLRPEILISGSGISHAPDPAKEAGAIKKAMEGR